MGRQRKAAVLDEIVCGNSKRMTQVSTSSVQVIVTSPPYNVGVKYHGYDDNQPFDKYLDMLKAVWQESYRVLVPGGRIVVNVANTGRRPYVPLDEFISAQLREIGFLYRGKVPWIKGASAGASTAWGSFGKSSNPVLRDTVEYILIFCKDSYRLERTNSLTNNITSAEYVEFTLTPWRFPAHRRNGKDKIRHPVPFPLELPERAIKLFCNEYDVVLDPFCGSGQTLVAAVRNRRHFIGYDISQDACNEARERVTAAVAEMGEQAIQNEKDEDIAEGQGVE